MSEQYEVRRIGRDPDALEAFYREHIEAVSRFVARRVSDPHTAADVTADIFMAAIGACKSYRPSRGKPVAWLFGLARNVVADYHRSQSRELKAVSKIAGRRLLDADSVTRIEERIDAERRARELYESLDDLPEDDRKLFELVALDGLSITDAAAVLGVKPNTARVRLHRSRARIQSIHGNLDDQESSAPITTEVSS